nr:reductive dehalogenase [uncultured bacterium]
MTKFHSTVSRRDFMKGLGLVGGGLGGASLVAPQFQDLDDMVTNGNAGHKLPWFVKSAEVPTSEIDWQTMKRYDKRDQFDPNIEPSDGDYPNLTMQWMAEQKADIISRVQSGKSGAELKDLAVCLGSCWGWIHESISYFDYFTNEKARVVLPGAFTSPQEEGLPKYQGNPEENAKMVRAALHYFGAAHVSFQELDDNRLKMIFSHDSRGKPYVFEDAEFPSVEPDRYVIPKSYKYVISYLVVQNMYTNKTGESWDGYLGGAAVAKAYSELNFLQGRTLTFLKALGYGGAGSNPGHVNGFAVLGGQGEMGRANLMIHPVYGMVGRVPNFALTNLPLPTDKPIDFGAMKFCVDCKKCAELCPSASISLDDEPSWETTGPWNAGGVKTWYCDWKTCLPYRNMRYAGLCGNCQGVCVFSKFDDANIHDIIKATVSTTGVFNSFFRTMDDAFGYKNLSNEDWWNREIPNKFDATNGRWW